jgi:hypothetical protein
MEFPQHAIWVISTLVACGSMLFLVVGVAVLRRRRPVRDADIEHGNQAKSNIVSVRASRPSLPGGSAGPA